MPTDLQVMLVSTAELIPSEVDQSSLPTKRHTRRAKSKAQVFTVHANSSDSLNLIKLKIYERAPVDDAYPAAQVRTDLLHPF